MCSTIMIAMVSMAMVSIHSQLSILQNVEQYGVSNVF